MDDVTKMREAIEINKSREPLGEQIRTELLDWIKRYGIVTVSLDTEEHSVTIDIAHLPPEIKPVLTHYGSIYVRVAPPSVSVETSAGQKCRKDLGGVICNMPKESLAHDEQCNVYAHPFQPEAAPLPGEAIAHALNKADLLAHQPYRGAANTKTLKEAAQVISNHLSGEGAERNTSNTSEQIPWNDTYKLAEYALAKAAEGALPASRLAGLFDSIAFKAAHGQMPDGMPAVATQGQKDETGIEKCFRLCTPTADRKLCADESGLNINFCGCECHDKFPAEHVGGSPARSVGTRVDLDVLAEKLDTIVCTLPRYACKERNIKAFREVLEAALPGSLPSPAPQPCDRCHECTSEALEHLAVIENADLEEGQSAVFELRNLLPTLDKFIKWEVEDAVAKLSGPSHPSEPHDLTCIFLSSRGLEGCNCSAKTTPSHPNEGTRPTFDNYVRIIERNEEPTSVQIRVGDEWCTVVEGCKNALACLYVATFKAFAAQFVAAPSDTGREQPSKIAQCRFCKQMGCQGQCLVTPANIMHRAFDFTPPKYDKVAQEGFAKLDELAPVVPPAQAQPERLQNLRIDVLIRFAVKEWRDDLPEDAKERIRTVFRESIFSYQAAELRASDPQKGQGWEHRVLEFMAKWEISAGQIWWRTDGEYAPITFFANCSDEFVWACADSEPIIPENFELLKSTFDDCAAAVDLGHCHAIELFCARVRKQRPQGASYKLYPSELWPLFDACGPEREINFGNPSKVPAPPSVPAGPEEGQC